MTATESPRRTDVLSRPKAYHPDFSEDRRSVYWLDRYPPQLGQNGTTEPVMTPRLSELCQAKSVHPSYVGHRPSPIWNVTDSAKRADASERLSSLAEFKPVHSNYVYERSAYTRVNSAAQNADGTERLTQLGQPKKHKIWANSEDTIIEGEFSTPISKVTPGAKNALCSERVSFLSQSKQDHQNYLGERSVMWPVSGNAMNASATLRLQQLARPKSSGNINDDYDFYKVSHGARIARPSPRTCELSLPLPRKVRQKKA